MTSNTSHKHRFSFFALASYLWNTQNTELQKLIGAWDLSKCCNPKILQCRECFCFVAGVCGSSDEDKCKPCEVKYRRRVRTVAREPLLVARPGSTIQLTITAPGARPHCLRHRSVRELVHVQPDGTEKYESICQCDFTETDGTHEMCPCTVPGKMLNSPDEIARWNLSAVARWNDFCTDIRRHIPQFRNFEYFKAVEPQERGAIHVHALIIAKQVLRIDATVHALFRKYAILHGFGHQIDIQVIANGRDDKSSIIKAARYVAKYVSKTLSDGRKKVLLPERSLTTPGPNGKQRFYSIDRKKPYRYRAWTASRGWGMSLHRVIEIQTEYQIDQPNAHALSDYYLSDISIFQADPSTGELYVPKP